MKKTIVISLITAVTTSLLAGQVIADDTVLVTTINPPTGTTDCTNNNFGYPLGERAVIVRGRPNHKVRIERGGVDIGLERASLSGCGPSCDAKITRKGNFDSGTSNNLIERKGFVELELDTPSDSSIGNATLVLHYALGGRGEYKLNIIHNSRVDRVDRTVGGPFGDRFTLTGNNLDRITNRFIGQSASNVISLTRVSEADHTLVVDRNERSCVAATFNVDLKVEGTTHCKIRDVKLPITRDSACGAGGGAGSAPPLAPLPPPPVTGGNSGAVRLNLTPTVSTPTPFFRSFGALLPDNTAQRRRTNDAFCAAFGNDEERSITLPPIRWGIAYANLPSPSPVSADVLDGNGNLLQRRTADPITVGNGSDARFFDNWTGRTTTVRVLNAQSVAARVRMGLPPAPGQTPPAGCYLAPGEPLTRFDPPRLTFRVNTGTPPAAETQTNDNEITL